MENTYQERRREQVEAPVAVLSPTRTVWLFVVICSCRRSTSSSNRLPTDYHPLTMFRLGTLRPFLQTAAPRLPSKNVFITRPLSTLRPQGSFMKTNWRPKVLWQSSRTYMAESPIVQQAQGFSWQRVAISAVCFYSITFNVFKLRRHHACRQQ